MGSEKRFWTSLALILVLGALLAPRSATASSSDAMAIDAVPGGGVDASVSVPEAASFDVDIVITEASTAYQGYQDGLSFNKDVLNADAVTQLQPAGLTACAGTPIDNNAGTAYDNGCANVDSPTTFTGAVTRVTFHCVGAGTSPLHLVSLAEDPNYGSEAIGSGGVDIETALADASVTCGGEGPVPTSTPITGPSPTPGGPSPTPGGPTPTPGGPVATPTPLPPGFEAVDLAAGCNPVTTTYADATPIGTIAGAVGPAGNLEALWELEGTGWLGYSPAYPEASDLTAKNFLDVVFVCVTGPGAFVRPIV